MKFFNHPEGYIEPDGAGGYGYVYQYKDIWRNIRITYSDDNKDGVVDTSEIRREQNYYPFGLNTHEWKYRISDPTIGRFWQIDPLAENFVNNATYAFSENRVIDGWELEGKERVDMHSSDPNLQDLSPEERQAFNRAQNEALTFVIDQVLDEIPIVGEIKDIINGESIGTILLGIIPFGKKAKTVVEGVSDIKKTTKKLTKTERKQAQKQAKKDRKKKNNSSNSQYGQEAEP